MFLASKPSPDLVNDFLARQKVGNFSYPDVGGLRSGETPAGYHVDRSQIFLGSGEVAWQRAKHAIDAWQMFQMPWVQIYRPGTPLEPGKNIAIAVRHLGFWSLNACRIVNVIREERRYGFSYGTLLGHSKSGEERFVVERRADDFIWYDLTAFSRLRAPWAEIGCLLARHYQRRFAKCSMAAMRQAVLSGW